MLTEEKINKNRMKFMELLTTLNIDLTQLDRYLEAIDYFHKPASPQTFRAYPGGLCQYALDVYYELSQLAEAYFPGRYTNEDIIKVALFKDIYRAEVYEAYNKNVKNEVTGQWETQLAYRYKDVRPTYGDMGFSSYMTARHFLDFTDEQIEAITMSNTRDYCGGDIHDIFRSYPLVSLAKMADIVACYLSEE